MKKILFDTKFGLEKAVLEGRKTQKRGTCMIQPPYENVDVAFPCCWIDEDNPEKDPLYGAFCWVNKNNPQEHTDWIKPMYRVGEIIAIAQSYKVISENISKNESSEKALFYSNVMKTCYPNEDIARDKEDIAGWTNKMLVRPSLMPHQIRITNVRIQRLQNISDEDCLAEGIIKNATRYCFKEKVKQTTGDVLTFSVNFDTPREAYAALIEKLCRKGIWDYNPWVWAYTFELVK